MNNPTDLKYTKDHEWARVQGKNVVVGITFYAQDKLGDVVFVDLPKVGAAVTAGKSFGTVESTKAVSDLFAPVSGKVVKVNQALLSAPEPVNKDPYQAGWMIEVEMSDAKQAESLLGVAQYEALLAQQG